MDGLDLLADQNELRAEVREVLTRWTLDSLPAAQQSAAGYPEPLWQRFRETFASLLTDPLAVRIALEEVGYARCPLPSTEVWCSPSPPRPLWASRGWAFRYGCSRAIVLPLPCMVNPGFPVRRTCR